MGLKCFLVLCRKCCGSILSAEENVPRVFMCVLAVYSAHVCGSERRCIILSAVLQDYRGPPELIFTPLHPLAASLAPPLLRLIKIDESAQQWRKGVILLLSSPSLPHSPLRTQLMCLIWGTAGREVKGGVD